MAVQTSFCWAHLNLCGRRRDGVDGVPVGVVTFSRRIGDAAGLHLATPHRSVARGRSSVGAARAAAFPVGFPASRQRHTVPTESGFYRPFRFTDHRGRSPRDIS